MTAARRLAAILAADVAGYSRMMEADGEGTLERLKALRREVLDQQIAEHHGRIVKTTGDGLLAEFASVVNAVRGRGAAGDARAQRGRRGGQPHRTAHRYQSRRRPRAGILLGVPIALFDRALVLNPSDARCWYARRRE
jgi:adenylate cyclase